MGSSAQRGRAALPAGLRRDLRPGIPSEFLGRCPPARLGIRWRGCGDPCPAPGGRQEPHRPFVSALGRVLVTVLPFPCLMAHE